ncbi:MAG: nucleotidyltransferase domain-containing protein [Firmicutes bacterium]|nr:nucleotidyltransferase domain-containing protein [Bacillota bacterium]
MEKYSEPDEKGRVKRVGMATAGEIFDKLEKHLKDNGMLPDDYFLMSHRVSEDMEVPKYVQFICQPSWGESEGIYLDIAMETADGIVDFATGKTLEDNYAAFKRMGDIATECNLMLNSNGRRIEREGISTPEYIKQHQAKAAEETKPEQAETKKQPEGIIGNTPYKFIPDKTYATMPEKNAKLVSERFESEGIKYSGKIKDNGSITLTYSKNDKDKCQAIISDVIEQLAVEEYRDKTRKSYNTIADTDLDTLEAIMTEIVQGKIDANELDVNIKGLALYGSRSRGLETGNSDIDIVVEYEGDMKEDALFNILNEDEHNFEGLKVDFNPIREEESGRLSDFLQRSEEYLQKQIKTQAKNIDENIIGNTVYRYIPQKRYKKFPAVDGITVSDRLTSEDIKHSGRINDDDTVTITYSAKDKEKVEAIFKDFEKQEETVDVEETHSEETVTAKENNLEKTVSNREKFPLFPDDSVTEKEMHEYGYTDPVMYPLSEEVALDFYENKDLPVYLLHEDNTESFAYSVEDIKNHRGMYGIETDAWEKYLEQEAEKAPEKEKVEEQKTPAPKFDYSYTEPIRADKIPDAILFEALTRGTGFANGRFRVEEWYKTNLTAKERVANLKNEYGIGGTGHPTDGPGEISGTNHDGKGFEVEWTTEDGKAKHLLTWSAVDKEIKKLIEKDLYISPQERDKHEKELFVKSKIKLMSEGDMFTVNGENFEFVCAGYSKIEVYPDNPDSELCYTIQGKNEDEPHYFIDNYRLEKTDFAVDPEKKEKEEPLYKFFRTGNDNELKILYQPNMHDYISATVDKEVFNTAYIIADTGNTFDTSLFYQMLLAYAEKETVSDDTLFYMSADNEYKNGIPLFEGFTSENVDLIGDYVKDDVLNLEENAEVEAEPTVENENEPAVAIGDKFKNLLTGEEIEIVSLTGALPYYTDQCTATRQSGGFEITENIGYSELLDTTKYERVTEAEKSAEPYSVEKALITAYMHDEFDEEPDFSDIEDMGLAYTSVEDANDENHIIEARVNLETREIYKYLDNEKVAIEAYGSRKDFIECLKNLDFNDLTEVTDEMWTKYNEIHKNEEVIKPVNFTFTEENMNMGSPKEQFKANIEAIKMLKQLESENKQATPEQQVVLAKYMGWGGLADAFDSRKDSWATEYNELKDLLSPEEYSSARATVLNSHFTSPVIIQAMYKGLERLGFEGGTILEPSMGIGNFFGAMPDSLKNSKLYGVELDDLTGRIAKQLYPEANIQIKGFQKTTFNSNSFDVAIGNVPFGTTKIYDNELQCHDLIHDYFFKKSLDKVHSGGIVALVTSMGTMDKANEEVRKYLAERAELVGAIRLPDTAFKNANTSVTSDIIFLKKRDTVLDFEKNPEQTPDWVQTKEDENGNIINSYFVDHPEMIVGEMQEESGPYGYRLVCKPVEGDFKEQLNEAISHLNGTFERDEHANSVEEEIPPEFTEVDYQGHRNFCYCEVDGKIYFRENEMMIPQDFEGKKLERMKGMIEVSNILQELIRLQRDGYSDDEIKAQQEVLNDKYEAFTKKFGLISSDTNMNLFRDDDTSELISSLENIDENGNLVSKADIFTKRTIVPYVAPTHADTVSDALTISIAEKARVDLDYMSKLCGKDKDTILSEMQGVIFENPVSGKYETADEYLSGDVREKLRIAEVMAENNDKFAVNVNALREVQPEELKPSEISIQLCSTWIPVKYYEQFMYETFDTPYRCQSSSWYAHTDPFSTYNSQTITIQYDERTATYGISNKGSSRADASNIKVNKTYGTSRVNAYKILEDTLNNKVITVKDYIEEPDGKKRAVVNQKETMLAQEKQSELKEKFREWIWDDPERTEELCRIYNENFNSIRPREYDGSHIKFVGMNPEIQLRPHQLNAIAHTLYGGNTLLAHTVGAGKTFEAVASAMEAKRLGLCRKSLICVPKHIVNQFGKEFLQLYPNANILVASEKDFQKKNRRRFFSRIATGNYDAVIISHSQLEKLPISPERRIEYVQNQIEEVTAALDDMRRMEGKRGFTVKQLEITCQNLEDKLEKLINEEKYDTNIFFEDMGFDKMFIDEAHLFKNLQFITKMGRNVSGINASSVSQRATDLALKVKYMDEITGGRGTVFMTGTPISNSMSELYIMQTYLQADLLKKRGLHLFDAWAANFGETQVALELAPEGKGYQAKTRFAKFFNLPELMNLFRLCADIKMPEDLNLPVPEAHYEAIKTEASDYQKELVDGLAERASSIRTGCVDPRVDNMLKITNEGRKLALDQRLINDTLPDDPNSKVNKCIENVLDIWEKTADSYGTQMIFCDMSTPKPDEFNVYDDIKQKLIAKGVSESEIAYIHDAKTDVQKQELFTKVNRGDVRILLGSTNKMGAGTNCQKHLTAVHHLDCPWRPADLEQRNGRIIRQGNENKEVNIYNYVTAGTFDAFLFQLVENKQKFISQIMTSKSPQRIAEDVDEAVLNYAQIKALAAGDERIKEKMDLDLEVTSLRTAYSNFLDNRRNLKSDIVKKYPELIAQRSEAAAGFEKDIATYKAHTSEGFSGMTINGKLFDDKKEAGKALLDAVKAVGLQQTGKVIGSYKGFDMAVDFNKTKGAFEINLKGALSHRVELGGDVLGNIQRLDNELNSFEKKLAAVKERLADAQNQLKIAKQEVEKPFPKMEELKAKEKRLNELNKELSLDKQEESEVLPDEPNKTERDDIAI